MQQIVFKFDSDEIELFYQKGAMYAYAQGAPFEETPVELRDKIIFPGQFISRIGEKKRSSFEMSEGNFLRYVGKSGDYILFSVTDFKSDCYYAFGYVSKNILMILNKSAGRDIRLDTLEIIDDFK